jgi:hypothetical protein
MSWFQSSFSYFNLYRYTAGGEKVDSIEGADAGKITSTILGLGVVEKKIPDPEALPAAAATSTKED